LCSGFSFLPREAPDLEPRLENDESKYGADAGEDSEKQNIIIFMSFKEHSVMGVDSKSNTVL
jgi:hypothetical protein